MGHRVLITQLVIIGNSYLYERWWQFSLQRSISQLVIDHKYEFLQFTRMGPTDVSGNTCGYLVIIRSARASNPHATDISFIISLVVANLCMNKAIIYWVWLHTTLIRYAIIIIIVTLKLILVTITVLTTITMDIQHVWGYCFRYICMRVRISQFGKDRQHSTLGANSESALEATFGTVTKTTVSVLVYTLWSDVLSSS